MKLQSELASSMRQSVHSSSKRFGPVDLDVHLNVVPESCAKLPEANLKIAFPELILPVGFSSFRKILEVLSR